MISKFSRSTQAFQSPVNLHVNWNKFLKFLIKFTEKVMIDKIFSLFSLVIFWHWWGRKQSISTRMECVLVSRNVHPEPFYPWWSRLKYGFLWPYSQPYIDRFLHVLVLAEYHCQQVYRQLLLAQFESWSKWSNVIRLLFQSSNHRLNYP